MVVSEGLMEEVTSEQRPEGDNGENHAGMWGKSASDLGNSQCKGPGAGHVVQAHVGDPKQPCLLDYMQRITQVLAEWMQVPGELLRPSVSLWPRKSWKSKRLLQSSRV